ncbi:glycosyltransferase [Candidatus Omnitrophota bacterium]
MKIAYIDHSFKKKTKSNDFLYSLLKDKYEVERFWDDGWNGGKAFDLKEVTKEKFDCLILFQVIYSEEQLEATGIKNIIFIPMYDALMHETASFWMNLRKVKVLCFSWILYKRTKLLGLDSMFAQYYPKPKEHVTKDFSKKKVFFWQRTREINKNVLKKLFGKNAPDKLYFHHSPDPGEDILMPTREECNKCNITTTEWTSSKNKYYRLLDQCNIFIAPRQAEGIGLAFLEAMARGMIVVGHNRPTMNEYIRHGKTGFLFDLQIQEHILLENLEMIAENAKLSVLHGYKEWQRLIPSMYSFIERNVEVDSHGRERYIQKCDTVWEKLCGLGSDVLCDDLIFLGQAYELYEEYTKAKGVYLCARGITVAKNDLIRVERALAELLKKSGDNEWREQYKHLIELYEFDNSKDSLELYQIASIYQQLDELDEAIEGFKRIASSANDKKLTSGAYFHLGEIAYVKEEFLIARRNFLECLKRDKGHKKAKEYLGKIK